MGAHLYTPKAFASRFLTYRFAHVASVVWQQSSFPASAHATGATRRRARERCIGILLTHPCLCHGDCFKQSVSSALWRMIPT